MAYSNVTPPVLPVFDTTAYPNYVLVFNYDVGATDWYEVHLMASASAFYYDTAAGHATINETSHLRYEISTGGSEWTEWGVVEATPTIKPGQTAQIYQRIWTSHDILDTAGNVWLAADSITPVEDKRDLRSHVLGIVLALIQKALSPIKAKQPTAYLYNGVKLPALPEWDREMYPYAVLFQVGITKQYALYFAKDEFYRNTESKYTIIPAGVGYVLYRYASGDALEWSFNEEKTDGASGDLDLLASSHWANYDFKNDDGTVYVPASNPIPVYE